jgi:predicted ATPase/DNA-binding winged helix-turn-helix (wHTH) protein
MSEGYRFGSVEIRPSERQVLVEGRPAALGSRAFDVLLALVERRDRVVTKNELLDLAWPGLVVEENNLQAQVSALRRVLGPQAIATIPGRGYRFTIAEQAALPVTKAPGVEPGAPLSRPATERRLPRLAAPLVGRHDELAALGQLLERHRLVTVSGAAGIGKTSVAVAAASEREAKLRDGVAWIELGPIAEPMLVTAAIARALDVQPPAGGDAQGALIGALKNKEVLLVVDNAEHVLDAVARCLDAILEQAPGVAVLATSRSALKLKHERVFRLGPLGVPEADVPADEARAYGAVALLETRAQALDPRFALTDDNVALAIGICRNLDGIALAIELAAARLPLLGMKGLAERVGERFRLLTAGTRNAPTRQQTLLAALDWSYELLSSAEQKVFRRLGVFAGGFALAMATAVVRDESTDEWDSIDALGALVDRSLVEVGSGATPRYRLLESTRAYALLKLHEDARELADAQRAHAAAMLAFFEAAEDKSWAMPEDEWLAIYAPELDNLRAAMDWSAQQDTALGTRLVGQSRFLFVMQGLDYELRQRCERLEPPDAAVTADAAAFWHARGEVMRFMHRDRSHAMQMKAAQICAALGDARGRYVALSDAALTAPGEERRALVAEMMRMQRADWPARVRFWGLRAYAYVAMRDGRREDVGASLESALELARASRSRSLIDRTLSNLADHALAMGDMRRAIEIGRELVRGTRGDYNVLVVEGNLANALLQAGEIAQARDVIASLHGKARAAQWDTFATYAPVFALLAASEGRVRSAARLLGYADMRYRAMGENAEPNELAARELASKRIAAELAPEEARVLMAEGERLSEDEVCALTLERPLVHDAAG